MLKSYNECAEIESSSALKIVNEEDKHYIEKILLKRKYQEKYQFLIWWMSWESHKDTWKTEEEVNQTETLEIFLENKIKEEKLFKKCQTCR